MRRRFLSYLGVLIVAPLIVATLPLTASRAHVIPQHVVVATGVDVSQTIPGTIVVVLQTFGSPAGYIDWGGLNAPDCVVIEDRGSDHVIYASFTTSGGAYRWYLQ